MLSAVLVLRRKDSILLSQPRFRPCAFVKQLKWIQLLNTPLKEAQCFLVYDLNTIIWFLPHHQVWLVGIAFTVIINWALLISNRDSYFVIV